MGTVGYMNAVRAALRTTTGTQNFTWTGFGTPVGAIVLLTGATNDNASANDKRWSVGFTDLTNQRVAATMSKHNVGTGVNYRAAGNAKIAILIKNDGSTNDVEIAYSATVTDGIQLNVTKTDGTAYLCTVILIGGPNAKVFVGDVDMPNGSANDTLSVTAPGFQPSWIFFAGLNLAPSSGSPTPSAGEMTSLGIAANTAGGIKMARVTYAQSNGNTTSRPSLNTPADLVTNVQNVLTSAASTPLTKSVGISVSAFGASGFTVTNVNGGDPPSSAYIAVDLGQTPDLQLLQSPATTPGTKTVAMTNAGMALFLSTQVAATGDQAATTAGEIGIGFASRSEEFSIAQNEKDAATTTVARVVSTSSSINVKLEDNSGASIVGSSSFDNTQITVNFTTVQVTARNQYILILPTALFQATAAGTFKQMSGSATAVEVFTSTAAGSFQHMTGTAVAVEVFVASAGGTFQHATAAAIAVEAFVASAAGTFKQVSASAVAQEVFAASAAGSFQHMTGAAVAQEVFVSTAAGSFQHMTGAATAQEVFIASAAGTFQHWTAAATDAEAFVATAAGTFQHATASATALEVFVSSGAGTFAPMSGSATAQVVFIASGAATFQHLVATAVAFDAFVATGAGTFKQVSASAAALVVFSANGAGVFQHWVAAVLADLPTACSVAATFAPMRGGTINAQIQYKVAAAGAFAMWIAHASDSKFSGCPTDLAASTQRITALAASTSLESDLAASYDRVTELNGSTC